MSCTRVMNSVIQRSSNAGMIPLLHLIAGNSKHLVKIRAVDPTTNVQIEGIAITVDTSINPRMAFQEGYDTQVLVEFDYGSLFPSQGSAILYYKLQMTLTASAPYVYDDISATTPPGTIPNFSVQDVVLLDINVGVRDTRPGNNLVLLTQPTPPALPYYEIVFYNPPITQPSQDDLTLVCTIGITGGSPNYSVNVYETEDGPLTTNSSEPTNRLQYVSATVNAATSVVNVYYEATLNPVYGRNHNIWTLVYVSISDSQGHAFQVPLKIFAYEAPAFAAPKLTYDTDTFTRLYGGTVAASPQLHTGNLLPASPLFLIGTFNTTCALDDVTTLSVTDVDTLMKAGYSIVHGVGTAYSLYYDSAYTPGFPAGHFSASISISEYGRTFSTCTLEAYVYRRLQFGGIVTGRSAGTVLPAVGGVYGTFYYPDKDQTDVNGRVLVASFTVSGGLVASSDNHRATASVVSKTMTGDVIVSVDVAARTPSTVDVSTISVYMLATNSDSGRGDKSANVRVEIAGSFSPDKVVVDFQVFSNSNPGTGFNYNNTNFNMTYGVGGPRAHATVDSDAVESLVVGQFSIPTLLPGATVTLAQGTGGGTGGGYSLATTDYTLTYTGNVSDNIHAGVSIAITENGLTFSGTALSHYIYRSLHVIDVLNSRNDASVADGGTYATDYYPSHVSALNTVDSRFTVHSEHGILIGTYMLSGGKELGSVTCTLNSIAKSVSSPTLPAVTVIAVGATRVNIYLLSDGTEPASRDRSVHGNVGVTINSVFVAYNTNEPESITPDAFKVFAIASPSFGVLLHSEFTRVYESSQAQALASGTAIGPSFPIGTFTMESATLADAATFASPQYSRGPKTTNAANGSVTYPILYTPAVLPYTQPSYDLRELLLNLSEPTDRLTFSATVTYYIYPQITVVTSVQRYIALGTLGECKATVNTEYGLGDYTLDLNAVSSAIDPAILMAGFTADRDASVNMSFIPSSKTLSIAPGSSTSTTFAIALSYS